jgi:ATP-binding cassette subfamily B (MDR/TAP) protein 1
MMIMFFSYGLALWYGATLIANGTVNPSTGNVFTGGDVVSVFFAVLMGSFAIGQAGACAVLDEWMNGWMDEHSQ